MMSFATEARLPAQLTTMALVHIMM